ncbi:MAG: TIGR02647 family protein [Pseudomonadaceae bacterium]
MLTPDEIQEINLLNQFNLSNSQAGLKIHGHDADPATIAAAERLFAKGMITQHDGGYLTSLGLDAAEHGQGLLTILRTAES